MDSSCIVLITGANNGIGYETAKAVLQSPRSYHVLLASRSLDKANDAIKQLVKYTTSPSTVEPIQLDICNDDSISKAFCLVKDKYGHIDVLVNNAGALFDFSLKEEHQLREVFNKTYDVNVSGTHVLTHSFAPLLLRSSDPRLLFVTSSLSNLTGLSRAFIPPGRTSKAGWPKPPTSPIAYRTSKAALNMLMLNWHWAFKEDGVKVWGVSPGLLATGLGGFPEVLKMMGADDPALGGQLIRNVIEGERDSDVGKIINRNGIQPW